MTKFYYIKLLKLKIDLLENYDVELDKIEGRSGGELLKMKSDFLMIHIPIDINYKLLEDPSLARNEVIINDKLVRLNE